MSSTYLLVEPENQEGFVAYSLRSGVYMIGRQEDSVDIFLADDQKVSRQHAMLIVDDGIVMLRDCESHGGVFIDGSKLPADKSALITPNNNVVVSKYLLYLEASVEDVEVVELEPSKTKHISDDDMKMYKSAIWKPQEKRRSVGRISGVVGGTISQVKPNATFQGKKSTVDSISQSISILKEEDSKKKFIFPPMPKVNAGDQKDVDNFIYNRINPIFDKLIQENMGGASDANDIRAKTAQTLDSILEQQSGNIPGGLSKEDMVKLCIAAFVDYGPLQCLLGDVTVTEIMVNSKDDIFIEQSGNLFKSHLKFHDEHELRRVIEKMVMVTNRRIDVQQPYQDTRLEDGSRVNVIISPLSLGGDSITIRKFPNDRLYISDLVGFKSMSQDMATFLELIVKYKANIIVSGGTGSGKTTLLNVLSAFIPDGERLVSIEDAAELRLNQPNIVSLETRPEGLEGSNAITIRDLVKNALRMRPDRVIVGECRGGESLDMLQAMNTGHEGSLTTLHANTPRDAIGRLETMCMMAGMDLPSKVIRQQIVSAIDFIVQQTRMSDGTRKVVSIQEVLRSEGDTVIMQEIFTFERHSVTDDGKIIGDFKATGSVPSFVAKLRDAKVDFPIEIFAKG